MTINGKRVDDPSTGTRSLSQYDVRMLYHTYVTTPPPNHHPLRCVCELEDTDGVLPPPPYIFIYTYINTHARARARTYEGQRTATSVHSGVGSKLPHLYHVMLTYAHSDDSPRS